MLYRKNFFKWYKYQPHCRNLTRDNMTVLLAALLVSVLSLTHSAVVDYEILAGMEDGQIMDFILAPQHPSNGLLKVENTKLKRGTDGRIRILGKRKTLLSKQY